MKAVLFTIGRALLTNHDIKLVSDVVPRSSCCVLKTAIHFDINSLFRPTHWKQTLFMLDRPVSVYAGDSVSGTILLRRNPVWRRHMSVTLHWSINSSAEEKDNSQANFLSSFYILSDSSDISTNWQAFEFIILYDNLLNFKSNQLPERPN